MKRNARSNVRYESIYIPPLGFDRILMESDGEFLTRLTFIDENYRLGDREESLPIFDEVRRWLDIYFDYKVPDFTPKYKLVGLSNFTQKVIRSLENIPYGEVLTYKEVCNLLHQGANYARAIGRAISKNPILIIIPCHRVISASGSLTGYNGGLENKLALLRLEAYKVGTLKKEGSKR